MYSVYVLEASTSNRLTHFYPPLVPSLLQFSLVSSLIWFQNLVALILMRPLRLCISSDGLRRERVLLLKITHMPIVAIIWVWEAFHTRIYGDTPLFSAVSPVGDNDLPVDGATSPVAGPRRQKPFLSNRANNRMYSQHLPELIHDDDTHSPNPQSSVDQKKKDGEAERVVVDKNVLEQRVEDLSAKIAELTALIMAQQGIADAEEF